MVTQSRLETIRSHPISSKLEGFRSKYSSHWNDQVDANDDREGNTPLDVCKEKLLMVTELRQALLALINTLQSLDVVQALPSHRGNRDLFGDLLSLSSALYSDNADTVRAKPLLDAVLSKQPDEVIWDAVYDAVSESTPPRRPISSFQQTPWLHNTGSFANSSEYRKHVDGVLKEELGPLYVGLPGFFEAYFGGVSDLESISQAVFEKCKEGDAPLYQEESGWQGWPEDAKERDVLDWPRRRVLAQPHKPIQGSIADRKMDVGFVDDPHADLARYRWSHILIPGELKSNPLDDRASKAWLDLGRYAREVFAAQPSRRFVLGFTLCGSRMRLWEFDRLGGIASESFDINEGGLQFVSAVLGFLWLNEEQLGFDATIVTDGNKQYIDIERNDCTERLIIDGVMKRTPCIAGRATTCWKAHREGDESKVPLVIKDSWQYPERDEEGELLREATEKGVVNAARYYHHETVHVGSQEDDIREMSESAMPPPSSNGHRGSRTGRSSTAIRRKRSSSCTNAPLPPSKRTCSSSPVKGGKDRANRKRRRVILRDRGEPIYKASSPTKLLAGLEGCIEGYESLQTKAGLLQGDVSPNNLIVNEDPENPSWFAFLIDLDLAIREQREKSSGALGKTGTRAFMAIGMLLDDQNHSYMHDLESFFRVLFWICVHYNGAGKDIGATEFESWNYESDRKLAGSKKSVIDDERDFLRIAEENLTPCYQTLIPCVNRLRRKVLPDGGRWRNPNPGLGLEMREILRAAQDDLKG
ncbi:hypothetical protein PMIN01_11998 [Paraphaeosphaeria minitans]|uniref:Fungal-type protein kinase domain-containing protein n=1 Tax=Paraphaeosphaeria minitans TaxID=565426 RepID=A0A9P6G7V9_9PLEO|nr:hypothetical protein PMIN01_11998 [Paraphaeosphaeria minitans]